MNLGCEYRWTTSETKAWPMSKGAMWRVASLLCTVLAWTTAASKDDLVHVSLYYESLCPFCRAFLNDTLFPLHQGPIGKLMHVDLVPYGNVYEVRGEWMCQHGPIECQLNTLEACALEEAGPQEAFAFVTCIERNAFEFEEKIQACATDAGMESLVDSIQKCADGKKGKKLFEEMGKKTQALRPPHQYVPWVTVNDVPLEADYSNLKTFVCAAYSAGPKPDACFETQKSNSVQKGSPGFLPRGSTMSKIDVQ